MGETTNLGKAEAEPVTVLTSANFEHLTQASTGQTTGKWFVKFYAPWCGHCKRLTPVWDELSTKTSTEYADDGIIIAKVDVTSNQELGSRFDIKGFPTLLFFANRKMYEYRGARDVDSLLAFVRGGYLNDSKTVNVKSVPGPPGWVEEQLAALMSLLESQPGLVNFISDIDEILSRRKVAAVFIFFAGLGFGTLVGMIIAFASKTKGKKKND